MLVLSGLGYNLYGLILKCHKMYHKDDMNSVTLIYI